jgi:hypothetical protein
MDKEDSIGSGLSNSSTIFTGSNLSCLGAQTGVSCGMVPAFLMMILIHFLKPGIL